MLRGDGTGQADATVGDGPHRDPSQRLGDGPLYVPSPVCAPAAAPTLFRTADPAAHPLVLIDARSIAGMKFNLLFIDTGALCMALQIDRKLFVSTFVLIFVAELPDKTAFATLLLATRCGSYR